MQTLDMPPQICAQMPTNALFEPLARSLLEPCARDAADKATTIHRRLKADLGRLQADAVLSLCNEVCLRHKGACSRYFTDKSGATLRLRTPENNAGHNANATVSTQTCQQLRELEATMQNKADML